MPVTVKVSFSRVCVHSDFNVYLRVSRREDGVQLTCLHRKSEEIMQGAFLAEREQQSESVM